MNRSSLAPTALVTLLLAPTGLAQSSGSPRGPFEHLPFPTLPRGSFVECARLVRTFEAEAAGDQFGWVSSPMPDLDGDGVREVIVSAPFHDAGGNASGRVYLYSSRTGRELFHVDGNGGGWQLGFAVRDAGDLNGDGSCDVIVGAPFPSNQGFVRVYSGKPSDHGALLLSQRLGANASAFGSSVTGLGDVNGDGVDDIAVGAPSDDSAGSNAGRVYVLSGTDLGASVLWTIDGAAGSQLGSALGRLRDVTGDGRDELIAGARNGGAAGRGRAFVYDVAGQTLLYTLVPDSTGVDFGLFFVASPGDVNADGFDDVYVADFSDGAKGPGTGKAYVFDGLDGTPIWTLVGEHGGDGFGIGRGAGDVDHDGHADLLLCSWSDDDGASNAGKAYVYSGRDLTVLQECTSTFAGEGLGFDAHDIGDVDGDGELDFFLTAATNSAGGASAGRCYVLAGGAPVAARGGGSAGSGGFVPTLTSAGCPVLGTTVEVELGAGLGGASGVLVLGDFELALPIAGATLVPDPLMLAPFVLGGRAGEPGAGSASFPIALGIDPASLGSALVLQGVVFDPGTASGLAFSDALRLERLQP